jgi:O-antigen ligase
MLKDLHQKIKNLPRLKLLIILFAIWQYICIVWMGMFHLPQEFIWLNLGLLSGFIVLAPVFESLLLLIISVPFFVVLPQSNFETLAMWRPLFALLFLVWLIRDKKFKFNEITFLPWDRVLGIFVFVGLVITLLFAQFPKQGLKQIVFWLNIYIFYLILINVLKSKQQIFEFIRYLIWSLTIIVTLGFTQLIGTFLTNLDTFWVYWASNITSLYYGKSFAEVALYSNSWFSYAGGRELRMFSIMPDSQSFAYICLFGLCIATALTNHVFIYVRKWLWSGIRFAGLGLILSGTRAVWVGMLVPFFVVLWGYTKNFQKHLAKKFILPFVIIFVLFAISPIINRGLGLLRVGFKEQFISRVKSIYDLEEPSNAGRIKIWKETIGFVIKHPLGVGFGNFISTFGVANNQEYEILAGEINERYNLPKRFVSAHNLYLQILVETGVFGLAVFLWYFYEILKYLWRFVKFYKIQEDFLVYFVAGSLIMILWVLASAFFDITLFNDKILIFFLTYIGLAGLIAKKYHEYENK